MSVRVFENWSRTVRSTPRRWETPASEAEVQAAVRRAGAEGCRIRPIGSAHSWSPIAAPEGVALHLGQLDRVIALTPDRVTVEAGCTLRALLDLLARNGLALPIVGSVDAQTLAGVTATGTHGSSLVHGNFSSLLRGMRLVDGRGELVELTEDDPRLTGGRVHLGLLGVLTQVTLAVVPAFRLRETLSRVPFEQVVDTIPAIARSAEYVKVWWLPGAADALVYRYERTDEPGEITARAWAIESLRMQWLFGGLLRLGGALPTLIPHINRAVDLTSFPAGVRIGRSDRVLTMPMVPVHRETEVAMPLQHTGAALRWLRSWLVEHKARADFMFEARFVPADEAWASPAWGRDTCQLGVYGAHSPDVSRYLRAFREHAVATWDGRPHLGKEHDGVDLAACFPRLGDLLDLADHFDPDGRFGNAWVDGLRSQRAARHQ